MKRDIRKILNRAGHTLFAAGALGLPVAVVAQTGGGARLLDGPAGESLLPVYVVEQSTPPAPVKVELALCANPMLFRYDIQVRPLGSVLEIHGTVPDATLRTLAVQVAQDESGMRVVDALRVQGSLIKPNVKRLPEELQRDANSTLEKTLGKGAWEIKADVWTNGQVLLKGSVATFQDKLAASRSLRDLPGCSCVVNQLTVVHPDAQTVVTAMATSTGTPANNQSVKQVAFLQTPTTPVAVPAPKNDQPVAAAPTNEPDKGKNSTYFATKWRRWDDQPAKSATPVTGIESAPQGTTNMSQVTTPEPKQSPGLLNLIFASKSANEQLAPPAQVSTPKPDKFITPIAAQQTAIVPEVAQPRPFVSQPTPVNASVIQPTKAVQAKPADQSATPALLPSSTDRAVLLPPVKSDAELAKQPLPSTMPYRVSTNVPRPVAKPIVQAVVPPSDPNASIGVIIFEETDKIEPASFVPAVNPTQVRLRQRIAATCGKSMKDVEVTLLPNNGMLVRLKAKDAAEGERLSDKIFLMPELETYQVSLDIPVSQ
jgi:hypothetical protein